MSSTLHILDVNFTNFGFTILKDLYYFRHTVCFTPFFTHGNAVHFFFK